MSTIDGVKIYDLRSLQNDPPQQPDDGPVNAMLSGGKALVRDPGKVTGIVIHQTAARFGVAPYQLQQAGGDRNMALARRSLHVRCHVMVFYDGFVAWPNELRWYIYHANGLNESTLGIEIDGNYPGIIGGETSNKEAATPVNDAVVAAARAGIHLLVAEGAKHGMTIQHVYAHRQSSGCRGDDPGQELWQRVVLEYAVPKLGLRTDPGRTWDSQKDGPGRPIPSEWDPAGVGHY